MASERGFLSLEEIADMLGVNYQLIYRLVRSGELPAIRLGRVYRVDRRDLDAYLERAKAAGPSTAYVCSACGKGYRSALSVGEKCSSCGRPICVDCWQRRGVRACREHQG